MHELTWSWWINNGTIQILNSFECADAYIKTSTVTNWSTLVHICKYINYYVVQYSILVSLWVNMYMQFFFISYEMANYGRYTALTV